MRVLAIDPGNKQSAWVVWNNRVEAKGYDDNDQVLRIIQGHVIVCPQSPPDHMAIEMVQSFGMAVGAEVFETVYWIGRFCQAWSPKPFTRVFRSEVKLHLCKSMRAKDANIRQAILDKFGGREAIGVRRKPGPLYGVSGDQWSALAVALTWSETRSQQKNHAPVLGVS